MRRAMSVRRLNMRSSTFFVFASDQQFAGDECSRFRRARICEKFRRRTVLDQPAAMQQHDRRRQAVSLAPRSCVAITTLTPRALTARTMSSIALVAAGSRLAVGSSRNSTVGIARQRARECQPLLLAAGQTPRRSAFEAGEPDEREQFGGAAGALATRHACRSQRVADIAGGAAPEHDRALEQNGAAVRRRGVATAPGDAAARDGDKSHGRAQQRGLAGAVRANQNSRSTRPERTSEISSRIVTSPATIPKLLRT